MAPEATLLVAGRDIEESDLALSFNKSTLSWTLLGQAEEYHMSKERQEIIKVLESAGGPLKLKEICSMVGKKEPVVHKLLGALVDSGFVEQPGYGLYQLVKTGETGENGESGKISENADNVETGSTEAEDQDWIRDFDISNNCNFNQVPA